MNAPRSRNKSKSMRNEPSNQAEVNGEAENKDENDAINDDTENDTPDQDGDNELDNDTHPNDQSDTQVKKSASFDGSKRVSPDLMEEKEHKKAVAASVKPTRRYQGRAAMLARHRDLSQERKRIIGRNSSLTPMLLKQGGYGLLTEIPDYYTTDGGDTLVSDVAAQFSNAQVRVLRDELQATIQECVEKEEMVFLLEKRLKETEQERNAFRKDNANKQQLLEKYQHSSDEHRAHGETLEGQCSSLKKEVEKLKLSQKQVVASKTTIEARLTRTLEEVEKLKADLRQSRQTAKETGENDKLKIEELTADNRRIEKQKTELLTAFKKQMKLIDNLKKQKMHLEAAKALQFTEEEFMRAIDWGS